MKKNNKKQKGPYSKMTIDELTALAEKGDRLAQNYVGICYLIGDGVEKDLQKAVAWLTKSAEQEYDFAQFNLALCYLDGEGVEQDLKQAAKLFAKAAEQGHKWSQANLGICYEYGDGVRKNDKKAVEWFFFNVIMANGTYVIQVTFFDCLSKIFMFA